MNETEKGYIAILYANHPKGTDYGYISYLASLPTSIPGRESLFSRIDLDRAEGPSSEHLYYIPAAVNSDVKELESIITKWVADRPGAELVRLRFEHVPTDSINRCDECGTWCSLDDPEYTPGFRWEDKLFCVDHDFGGREEGLPSLNITRKDNGLVEHVDSRVPFKMTEDGVLIDSGWRIDAETLAESNGQWKENYMAFCYEDAAKKMRAIGVDPIDITPILDGNNTNWTWATFVYFSFINGQLEQTDYRYYAQYSHNDLSGIFLNAEQLLQYKNKTEESSWHPYIPTMIPPNFGQEE